MFCDALTIYLFCLFILLKLKKKLADYKAMTPSSTEKQTQLGLNVNEHASGHIQTRAYTPFLFAM
jgi:hypothetical protein